MTNRDDTSTAPLGLPAGSVRALLTLLIVTVVVIQCVRGRPVGMLWVQSLMIALAHYFTSRRLVNLSPAVLRRLESEGILERESHPLYLPRGSVRALVVIVFLALAGYLYWEGHLFDSASLGLLASVFAYFLGMLSKRVAAWFTRGSMKQPMRRWEDFKAAAVLLLIAFVAGARLMDLAAAIPRQLDDVTIGLVLFYFGSR